MQALIDSYSPTVKSSGDAPFKSFTTEYSLNQLGTQSWSITYRPLIDITTSINARIFKIIEDIAVLNDNWDEDGAIAPDSEVIQLAKGIVHSMNAVGQEIYNAAPGPKGEIMLDLRSGNKSLEVIIYPDKMKFVKFSPSEPPAQGTFTPGLLFTDLIAWLNEQ